MQILKYIIQCFLLAVRDAFHLFYKEQEVSVLCYHSVSSDESMTAVSPDVFEKHLAMLRKSGAHFVSTREIVRWMNGGANLPQRAVAITFDDGYADFETNALPILEKFQAPATVFVVGDGAYSRKRLGNNTPFLSAEAVARVRENPLIEIGYHSATHDNLARLSMEEVSHEVTNTFGAHYFAYPGGNHSSEVADALRREGYLGAFTIGWNLVQKLGDNMYIPRSVILKDTPLGRVRFATTRALRWYRSAAHL